VTLVEDMNPTSTSGFRHEALFYSDDDEFLAGTVPFVLDGVESGEAVLVVVPEPRLAMLRRTLGAAAAHVNFTDMRPVGVNPARIIPVWQDFVDRHGSGGRAVRGIGEPIWAGRTENEIVECQIHESLLNVAFATAAVVTILCPYDHALLEPEICDEALRSHPWLLHGGIHSESGPFGARPVDVSPFEAALSPAPRDAHREEFGAADVRRVRQLVAALAARAGLSDDRAADLMLAVSEIVANSASHGGGSGTFAVWVSGGTVVCEVRDSGRIEQPLVGRQRPSADQPSGRGLWLANQLCDLVQIRVDVHGSIVRIHQRGPTSADA
jgi:anti-sigma regulatory factor (Ser/Thr protein kinase)